MKGIIFVLLACLCWASDTLIRYPLLGKGISAQSIVLFEHIFLTLLLSPILFTALKKLWKGPVSHLFYVFMIGVMGSAIGTLCFTKAFTLMNPSLVILLQKWQPIIALIFAKIFLGEPIKKKYLGWVFICLLGSVLISFDSILGGISSLKGANFFSDDFVYAHFLVMIAVVSWGGATVFGKKLSLEGHGTLNIMSLRFFAGLLALIPISSFAISDYQFSYDIWAKLVGMVIISGVLGMYFYYSGLRLLSARVCTLAELFFPVCAVILNWFFLGAQLSLIQLVGGGLLILGSTVVQLRRY